MSHLPDGDAANVEGFAGVAGDNDVLLVPALHPGDDSKQLLVVEKLSSVQVPD